MNSRRKKWPHYAEWARQDALDELESIVTNLELLVEGEQFTRTETLRRQALALKSAMKARESLIKARFDERV